MPHQSMEAAKLYLAASLSNQDRGYILQHHRLQRETAQAFPILDQGASMQPINGFERLATRQGNDQHSQQFIKGHRLAIAREPA